MLRQPNVSRRVLAKALCATVVGFTLGLLISNYFLDGGVVVSLLAGLYYGNVGIIIGGVAVYVFANKED